MRSARLEIQSGAIDAFARRRAVGSGDDVPGAPGTRNPASMAAGRAGGGGDGVLASVRAAAWERFAARGFPTIAEEDWKYTNLAPVARVAWRAPSRERRAGVREAVANRRLHLHGGIALVCVDGVFAKELSVLPPHVEGIEIGALSDVWTRTPDAVTPHLASAHCAGARPLVDLSTALFDGGVFLRIASGTCLPVPIEIVHVTTQEGVAVLPRTLVIAEQGSRVTLVEHHVSSASSREGADGAYATFPVVEVALSRNAAVEHVLWQEERDDAFHLATVLAHQERDSRFSSAVLTLGAALSRTEIAVAVDGEGAEATLCGVSFVSGTRHADLHVRMDHAKPHGTSRQLYKSVLDGHGVGVFDGKVLVRPDAQKTDAQQSNHNLLLSPDAIANTKPGLEIYADDVKCAHGATVGRLEDDKLFYLRSRGLDERAARSLLLRAFARDVTERITVEAVRKRLDAWMTQHLGVLAADPT